MKSKLITVLLFILVLGSCKAVLLKMYKVKNPKIENTLSLQNFLNKYEVKTDNLFATTDTLALYEFYNKGGIPDAYFFNKEGEYIEYRSTNESCNGYIPNFIDTLSKDNSTYYYPFYSPVHTDMHIDTFYNNMVSLPDLKFLTHTDNYDYTIVFVWTKYTGKLSIEHLVTWQDAVSSAKNRGLKINSIYLSLDYMEHFGMTDNEVPRFDY